MSVELMAGIVLWVGLTLYLLSGGADFGGGIWDLLASGSRADEQRRAISSAIGPIWEANHVWLILVLVLSFVCFPSAYSLIMTVLHIPITFMLVGIVLRGSAFVFRAHDVDRVGVQRGWSLVFSTASVVTPFMLGTCAGALAAGRIRLPEAGMSFSFVFIEPWLAAFPLSIGFLTLVQCAYLSAVYLTVELKDDFFLREDFRRRALISGVLLGGAAWLSFFLAREGAPVIADGLSQSPGALPFMLATGLCALGALVLLARRHYRWARALAIGQTVLIMGGWALSQFPFLVVPRATLFNSAAPESLVKTVLLVLAAGSILLIPAFLYLYSVFKPLRT